MFNTSWLLNSVANMCVTKWVVTVEAEPRLRSPRCEALRLGPHWPRRKIGQVNTITLFTLTCITKNGSPMRIFENDP